MTGSNQQNQSMQGKRVIVTAGADGIGLQIAKTYLDAGAMVAVCDINAEAVSALADFNENLKAFETDAADPDAMRDFIESACAFMGGLDVLVNNVGIAGPTAAVEDIEIEDWQRTINVDLNAQFYAAKFAVPHLKAAGGGSIVIMSSNAAFFGYALRSPYTASKWALIGFMKTLAMELGPDQIRVNAICPCSVEGPRIDGVIAREAESRGVPADQIREDYQRQSSLRTFVKAEDVANMALFLTSDMGHKISGQAIGVDGHTETLSQY